jgi:hypothetical protein
MGGDKKQNLCKRRYDKKLTIVARIVFVRTTKKAHVGPNALAFSISPHRYRFVDRGIFQYEQDVRCVDPPEL